MSSNLSPQQALGRTYDEGAAVYARYWAPALHRHARVLLDPVPIGPTRIVVDVAAGAGTLTPALRALAGQDGQVIALDRSRGMLRRARGPSASPG